MSEQTQSADFNPLSASEFAANPGISNALKLAATVASKIPPPWGPAISAALTALGVGHQYVVEHRVAVFRYALEPFPAVWARPTLRDLGDFSTSQYLESAKSLFIYRSIPQSGQWDDEADAKVWRTAREGLGIDGSNRHRLAQEIVSAMRQSGAPLWARAGVGYRATYYESRRKFDRANTDTEGKKWAAILTDGYGPAVTPGQALEDRIARWRLGQPQLGSASTTGVPASGGGGGAAVPVLGLLALLTLTR